MTEDKTTRVAAGLRGAFGDISEMPANATFKPVSIKTEDGAFCTGVLSRCGGEKCAVMLMHPREYVTTHYLLGDLLKGGVAVLGQAPRNIGNDIRLEHERALLDVAAGIRLLRNEGYEKVILLGTSGGASLFSLYTQQSNLAPAERLDRTPGGKPTPLPTADLPPVDGVIFLSPHPGQGVLLMNAIDPSVTDEQDAMSMDPELFPFHPANGFKRPPESSSYSDEFVASYRDAQRARVQRIDDWAKTVIEKRLEARARLKKAPNPMDMIVSNHTPILTVWRTDADLRCFDLSLDPSARKYGSLWGANPFISNFGSIGFARTVTADSWLSTWSGLSSNASLEKSAPDISQPTLMIVYDGDSCVFPADAAKTFEQIGAQDKEIHTAPGDHHGRPIVPEAGNGRKIVATLVHDWIEQRFK